MKVGIMACAGRMGRALLHEVASAPDLDLAGGVERSGNPAIGTDLGLLAGGEAAGLACTADAALVIAGAEVLIEFSTPEATLEHARLAAAAARPLVVGTTGLSPAQSLELRELGRRMPLLVAANMSLGVNLLIGLVQRAAAALDEGFDVEVLEMHHRHKVDAPSGTALALGRAAAAGRRVELAAVSDRGRDGLTGARVPGKIGFAALRGGDVVGDHSVIFAGQGERLILGHVATDRAIYARGALHAARWLVGQPAGLYGMADVLGLD